MTLGFIRLGIGVLIAFLSFATAITNFKKVFDEKAVKQTTLIDVFKGHLGAMLGMAIGGLCSTSGVIVIVWSLITKVIK